MKLKEEKSLQKVESSFVDNLLWCERHDPLVRKAEQEIDQGLENDKGNANRMKTLKNQKTTHAKGLGFSHVAMKWT